jgi:hypothetical protein
VVVASAIAASTSPWSLRSKHLTVRTLTKRRAVRALGSGTSRTLTVKSGSSAVMLHLGVDGRVGATAAEATTSPFTTTIWSGSLDVFIRLSSSILCLVSADGLLLAAGAIKRSTLGSLGLRRGAIGAVDLTSLGISGLVQGSGLSLLGNTI